MNFKFIINEINGGIAEIKLNRPEMLNSFNKEMGEEFFTALNIAELDEKIRCIVITGEGKGFCAGQDLAEAVPKDGPPADLGKVIETRYNPVIKKIRNLKKPVIAAVNGVAAGAGANIALCCDIVVASESASFVQAFSKIGLIPDSGGTYFLPRLIGFQKASAFMMLGDKISAVEAEELGMIYKVFPDNQFKEKVFELSDKIAQMPTKALALIKKALNDSMNNDLSKQLDLEKKLQIEAGGSNDYKEGVSAFLEKRKPYFKGS